jgi:hypothetical protein
MRSDGLLMRYLSNLQRLDESGSEKVRRTDRNRGFSMISRKKSVRIGIPAFALAFVRPGQEVIPLTMRTAIALALAMAAQAQQQPGRTSLQLYAKPLAPLWERR